MNRESKILQHKQHHHHHNQLLQSDLQPFNFDHILKHRSVVLGRVAATTNHPSQLQQQQQLNKNGVKKKEFDRIDFESDQVRYFWW